MDIVVCIKQVLDPEIPASQFKIDPVSKRQVQADGQGLVISTYDEHALEVALKLKEQVGGRVTALTLGEPSATSALRKALSMGADEAALVSDQAFQDLDAKGVAHLLRAAIKKIGTVDLVLCGCESADWGHRTVGPLLAEELGIFCVTFATRIEPKGDRIILRKVVEDGYELIEAPLPLLVTITSDETNVPRYPKVKDIMLAARKPIPTWTAKDLSLDGAKIGKGSSKIELRQLYIPAREARCELIEGETPEEQAERLAFRLRELKLL
ncbi:MAG: electron transfer flavoprotein subunit beta/FixA family protein [candidate division NC10 bacterium]|nr:electron transfer flavoprotein subunit beta/FixA family protein [candidate division NC10 bacterium]